MSARSRRPRAPLAIATLLGLAACGTTDESTGVTGTELIAATYMSPSIVASGREIFRFDTFGNETFWSDTAALHVNVNELTPEAALNVGLKVDMDALPAAVVQQIRDNAVDLGDPAITRLLLSLDAVVGVKGQVENGTLVRMGITCALCHSTVDDAVTGGIGHRLDGWPNRDLNVGAIIALSDVLPDFPYNTWGPGMYDPRFNVDGQNVPVTLPPAFGLRHVKLETYTGDGVVSYWNAYVAITQMHGHGKFVDPRINVNVDNTPPDLVASKLPALLAYQLSLDAPAARAGTFDAAAANRGRKVFLTEAGCARCHLGSAYTDVNANRLHSASEVGQNPAYAMRTATKLYRTTPLRGLWNPPQLDGPYFHDGSAPTLAAVVDHYVTKFGLTLTTQQKNDLVEFLKTL